MPLPRFHRLPPERQMYILDVARHHFAEHGPEAASYNKIIEAVGFSKTAAYQYFDGRDDLLSAVLDAVRERLSGALGPWTEARRAEEFWSRLEQGSWALISHLHTHPEDLALAVAALGKGGDEEYLTWFTAVVANGQRLGVIRTDIDRDLLVAVTAAVFQAADARTLARLRASDDAEPTDLQLWSLLRGLWSTPDGRESDGGHDGDRKGGDLAH
ncbi:hypothetical protein GCM10010387_61710 [Streptomyces inusitatus]|uniref:HTH tetR-type domain-containing protein n=1 Tax=Streptomyces inusitatus TaxID=68221 RepID=A0A918V294_9ACTN|nr:TetR/AcrR family transcriptional regulator [Streptomyces inusitatus]GGZ59618.1 hypothetical protein GCM10010387_61710 [Streptomyces inusitatus]